MPGLLGHQEEEEVVHLQALREQDVLECPVGLGLPGHPHQVHQLSHLNLPPLQQECQVLQVLQLDPLAGLLHLRQTWEFLKIFRHHLLLLDRDPDPLHPHLLLGSEALEADHLRLQGATVDLLLEECNLDHHQHRAAHHHMECPHHQALECEPNLLHLRNIAINLIEI